jgi:bifunctional ADP-heptose synthase (sugar kinase/adenylyltransferase)
MNIPEEEAIDIGEEDLAKLMTEIKCPIVCHNGIFDILHY